VKIKYAGILCILFASIMWAIEPVIAKLAYQNSDFLHTSAIRAIFVALTALFYGMLKRANFKVSRKQFSVLLYISLVGTLFADLIYFFALTQIAVVNAVLIAHMQPIFIILIGFLILKEEKLNRYDYGGIFFMMLSGLLVTTKSIENFANLKFGTLGDLLVLSATIAWATTAIAMKKYLRNINAGVITFYRFLIASIIFTAYLLQTSGIDINVYQAMVGIVVGIGTILYYEGLKRIKTAQVSALELSAPFFAAIFGFFILGEKLTLMQIIGTLLLFGGIYFLSKED